MSLPLKHCLAGILSPHELELLVGSYDVVGDIAIIIIPPELIHREELIGEAILANNRRIKVVARRDGIYTGEFRTIGLKVIGGEQRKETLHRENGVRLLVNPEEVYFSVRSSTERLRIAGLVEDGERVLVLFSGIAPFPLVIAKNSGAGELVGVEKNPVAHMYGLKNLALNRKLVNIRLLQGDVAEILPTLGREFDRVLMVLPTAGAPFLPQALRVLRPGGMLHFYDMRDEADFEAGCDQVAVACRQEGRAARAMSVVKCGHCGPRTYRICIDVRVE